MSLESMTDAVKLKNDEKRAFLAWCWVQGIKIRANAASVDKALYARFRRNENSKAGFASQNAIF